MSRSENRKTRTWCRAYSTSIANRSLLAIRSISASSEVACDRGRAALARAVDSLVEMLSFDSVSMVLSSLVLADDSLIVAATVGTAAAAHCDDCHKKSFPARAGRRRSAQIQDLKRGPIRGRCAGPFNFRGPGEGEGDARF